MIYIKQEQIYYTISERLLYKTRAVEYNPRIIKCWYTENLRGCFGSVIEILKKNGIIQYE